MRLINTNGVPSLAAVRSHMTEDGVVISLMKVVQIVRVSPTDTKSSPDDKVVHKRLQPLQGETKCIPTTSKKSDSLLNTHSDVED